jgi:G3E family GTPase
VVLNKRDRVTPERLAAWRELAVASNPRAQVHATEHGRLAAAHVLEARTPERAAPAPGQAAHGTYHSRTVTVPAGLPRARLQAALAPPFDIERVKGFVSLAEGPFLVHVVRGHATFEPLAAPPAGPALNKLVLISADPSRLEAQARALW